MGEASERERLGEYVLFEPLGEGRTSVVYRARRDGGLCDVALKVLKDDALQQDGLRQRFLNEGRVLRSLRTPNIVEIYELVFDDDAGNAYIAMELLRGRTLRRLLEERGPLSEELASEIGLQLAKAFVAVHSAGLLYRDLKPENVFVLDEPGVEGEPRVKLLDFGTVAEIVGAEEVEGEDSSTAVGTPYYMSPEQITDQDVDERADLYALGVVLFELLTGRVPFKATSYGELMLQLVTDPPPRIEALRGEDIDGALDGIVRRCLEKDPADRFSSAMDVMDALKELVVPPEAIQRQTSGVIVVPRGIRSQPSQGLRDLHTERIRTGPSLRILPPAKKSALSLALLLALLSLVAGAVVWFLLSPS